MWANLYDTANFVIFTKGSFNQKLHFLCSVILSKSSSSENLKSLALVDLKSVSPISPKSYIYNCHERYHDKVIAQLPCTWHSFI